MKTARSWHLLTATVTWVALALQLVLVIEGGRVLEESHPPPMTLRLLRFVAYFTIQSNLLVLVTTAVLARDPAYDGPRWRMLRTAAMTGIIVTGLVHWFLLRPLLHLQGADHVADKLLHLAVPVLAVIGWMVFGGATGWYPYPFLDRREHGWDHVAVVCAGIFVLWFALLLGEQVYDRRGSAPRPTPRLTGS